MEHRLNGKSVARSLADARSWRFAAGWLLALVLGVGALSGCSLFGGDDEVATDKPPQVEVGADGRVKNSIRSLTNEQGSYKITVDVIELKRYDNAARLVFAVTPQSKGGSDPLSSDFFSRETLGNDVTDVYLLDTENLRKYPVLMAGEDCVCSDGVAEFELDQPTPLFADYPLPPESVKSMTVVFGDVGPLPGVEVSS